jgi:hypothetical protein
MWGVVTGMIDTFTVWARTALSPEWDHGFDEAFAELVSSDPDLVQAEFDALIGACWDQPPASPPSPAPPASSAARPVPPPEAANPEPAAAPSDEAAPGHITDNQRSPP